MVTNIKIHSLLNFFSLDNQDHSGIPIELNIFLSGTSKNLIDNLGRIFLHLGNLNKLDSLNKSSVLFNAVAPKFAQVDVLCP